MTDVLPTSVPLPPLEIGMQTIQSSPYRSGVAGPQRTHLLLFPALPTCSCPLALSGLGQLFASESWTLNSGHLWWQFRPCVTRRTLSAYTALHPRISSVYWRVCERVEGHDIPRRESLSFSCD